MSSFSSFSSSSRSACHSSCVPILCSVIDRATSLCSTSIPPPWKAYADVTAWRGAGQCVEATALALARAIRNTELNGSVSDDRRPRVRGLADPTRRAVLERLGAGSATISELAEPFGMSLTGMKKHIRLLEEANLVATEKVGRARRCVLVPYAFEGISTWLQRLDRFAQVVERTKGAR